MGCKSSLPFPPSPLSPPFPPSPSHPLPYLSPSLPSPLEVGTPQLRLGGLGSTQAPPAGPGEFRSLKKVKWASFQADVLRSELYTDAPTTTDEFADQLDSHHQDSRPSLSTTATKAVRIDSWRQPLAVIGSRRRKTTTSQAGETVAINSHGLRLCCLPEIVSSCQQGHRRLLRSFLQ